MTDEPETTTVRWLGWAIELSHYPWLFVAYGGTEADAWKVALGWPSEEEISHAKTQGSRAFQVEITEVSR